MFLSLGPLVIRGWDNTFVFYWKAVLFSPNADIVNSAGLIVDHSSLRLINSSLL